MKTSILIISFLALGATLALGAPPPAPTAETAALTAGTAVAETGAEAETAATAGTAEDEEGEGEDRVSIGEDVTIAEGEVVEGDAVTVGANLTINGTVKGDAVATGGDVVLGPKAVVGGDVVTAGGKLTVSPGAKIGGEKVIVSGRFAGLKHLKWLGLAKEEPGAVKGVIKLVKEVVFFGLLMFVALLLTVFLPRHLGRVSEHLTGDFPRAALLGVGIMILLPIGLVLMAITIVGIPIIPLVLLATFIAGLAGYVAFAQIIGRRLVGERHPMFQVLIGLLLLQAAALVGAALGMGSGVVDDVGGVFRTLGTVILLAGAFIGMGAVVYSGFGRRTLAETVAAREKKKNGNGAAKPPAPA